MNRQNMALPFHPIIQNWFVETYGNPTSVQEKAWPVIESGENVLALAPTGSGKTLTAFLSAINRFCPGSSVQYPADKLSVLYVSPLKALNEDIKRNLLLPLASIRSRFEKEGISFPAIRVETRSGDTPQSERRRFLIHPPSILALTPESLAILLLNPRGRKVLSEVKYLIIDEIHAVLGNKRGAYLSCQIDRLALLAGKFQRISLSATVRNPHAAADFIGGAGGRVSIIAPEAEKKIDFSVEYPGDPPEDALAQARIGKYGRAYAALIDYVLTRIWEGKALLVFAESRRRAERLCYYINQEAALLMSLDGLPAKWGNLGGTVSYTHHGSLSKELRRGVEKGLSEGTLPCVVATASLELGIDIGFVDEVILAGSPGGVAQTLQRVGRSGHGVGQVSRGKLFALHGKDLLLAAALQKAVDARDIEEIRPIENPLDILAQLITAMCAEKDWDAGALFDVIAGFFIFRTLKKDLFNRVLLMLAGRGEKGRLRDVKPRIWHDALENKIGLNPGTMNLLYSSGGVIANRGTYSLRISDGVKIGEVDEEFVWERRVGDRFDFGARGWLITKIGQEAVEVAPLENRADFIPFWRTDIYFRSGKLTENLLETLDAYNASQKAADNLNQAASDSLQSFLDAQREAQRGLPLPDNKNALVEIIEGNERSRDFYSLVMHTFRGAKINYPLSLALSSELEEKLKLRVETFSNDDNMLFMLPKFALDEGNFPVKGLFTDALVSLDKADTGFLSRGERLFRKRLESSGVFGASFREAAERSLLLPKAGFGKRTPLWIMRQRARRLFDAVADEDGFPATAEAWRTCLVDIFDMDGFRDFVSRLNTGEITLSFFRSAEPSPFSRDAVRQEINSLMYDYDERKDLLSNAKGATLSDKVIEEAAGNAAFRPVLKSAIIDGFSSRVRREIQGWAPEDERSLSEWVKERIAIPLDEWETLIAAAGENVKIDNERLKTVMRAGASVPSMIHRELEEAWNNEPLSLLGTWLRFEGPVPMERICSVFGVSYAEAEDAVDALAAVEEVVRDVCVQDGADVARNMVCDRDNLEMLLRLSRKKERPAIKERPISTLVPFLALRQGFAQGEGSGAVRALSGWAAQAKLWETEILCARSSHKGAAYRGETLDREIREGRLVWYGAGKERVSFCRPEDLDLVTANAPLAPESPLETLIAKGFFNSPRDFWEIKDELEKLNNINSSRLAEALWREAWHGRLSSDSFEPVRRGLETGFI
ncbi:MAG: DEAD/DEAH box helicase, partial [Treponema sp.]|nr:DEAD/DEAH box helicase [Treponema sp.]